MLASVSGCFLQGAEQIPARGLDGSSINDPNSWSAAGPKKSAGFPLSLEGPWSKVDLPCDPFRSVRALWDGSVADSVRGINHSGFGTSPSAELNLCQGSGLAGLEQWAEPMFYVLNGIQPDRESVVLIIHSCFSYFYLVLFKFLSSHGSLLSFENSSYHPVVVHELNMSEPILIPYFKFMAAVLWEFWLFPPLHLSPPCLDSLTLQWGCLSAAIWWHGRYRLFSHYLRTFN